MKRFLLLLLCCLAAGSAVAQATTPAPPDYQALYPFAKQILLPLFGFYLLCSFVLGTIKTVLNYLLKRQIMAAPVSDGVVERLLPSPQDEQSRVVKWIALLLSTGTGLALCNWYLPLGLHSLVIMLFSTALGFLAYYLFLSRQAK